MTKKDFEVIAQVLRDSRPEHNGSRDAFRATEQINVVSIAFADRFAQMNPRFNRAIFLRACGVAS